MRPLIVIRRTPNIDFMAWHKIGFALSLLLTLSSIALFLTVGLNYGIDFVGGTLIEVRSTSGPANLAEMRQSSTRCISATPPYKVSARRPTC